MFKSIYIRLALTNLKKNKRSYVPFLLTSIITIMMFFDMYMIMDNSGVREMPGADSMRSILGFGMVIVAIFAFIFLFYTNSFLIKQRRKEIGLYNVLGMGKKELSIMMFWESLTTGGISIVIGLIGGAIFGKLMFLLLYKIDQKRYTEMMDYYGMWAHQIKTPIAAMRILVQSGMDREENEENQKLFRQLQMELFKTEQYVEMVLSYLKIGDIAKDMVLERCDLGKVVRQAVKKYSRLFILQKLSLEMGEIAEIVLTDEKWLSFVVEQILSNALKYTKSGSVSIYLEQEGVLVIKDTGIGISAEDRSPGTV